MGEVDQTKIFVDGDDAYMKEVTRLVRRILLTKTGQAIGFKIRTQGMLLIQASDAGDAQAETRSSAGRMAVISFFPNTKLDHANISLKMGSLGTLKVRTVRMSPGYGPDEILFHEMVHAARLIGDDDGPTKEEEFFAVLVANIYMSEKGKPAKDLRYRYETFSRPVTEQELEPFVFLFQYDQSKKEDHYDLIEKFCRQHPNIAPMIASAPAKFNPIRDYFDWKRESIGIYLKGPEEPISVPIRITQHEPYVPISDPYLIGLLEPRFRVDDVAGYGARARKLEHVFAGLTLIEAAPLLSRLISRRGGDRVATLFHGNLATQTRAKLINILRSRL